jgi:co-chaperonin GroES (HSP10)
VTTTVAVEPLGARVLVALRPLAEKIGHIIVPNRNEYARSSVVLATGPDVKDAARGMSVRVSVLAGQLIGDALLLPESSILGYENDGVVTPARGLLFVKKIDTQETFAGGRIVIPHASREQMSAHQMHVVAVGADERCENEDCTRPHEYEGATDEGARVHPADVRLTEGAWIYVQPRALVDASVEGEDLYFVRHDNVLAVLRETDSAVA